LLESNNSEPKLSVNPKPLDAHLIEVLNRICFAMVQQLNSDALTL
jgi:hypothetical protein